MSLDAKDRVDGDEVLMTDIVWISHGAPARGR